MRPKVRRNPCGNPWIRYLFSLFQKPRGMQMVVERGIRVERVCLALIHRTSKKGDRHSSEARNLGDRLCCRDRWSPSDALVVLFKGGRILDRKERVKLKKLPYGFSFV
ncbi:hypothetical protein CDAR_260531 [Caerostris darwini]|uniref:Uncharacterized protein n=1 Tax=Caerostris darwini TaxID=1538125 RepID=A0AAV4NP41_9ARAC|nr:hypothetical protein CDAR_260531 [Caerostris darwini]